MDRNRTISMIKTQQYYNKIENDRMDLMDKNWVRIEVPCDAYIRGCLAIFKKKNFLFYGKFKNGLTALDC